MTIRITLADLTYTNQGYPSVSFPFGAALVASYAKKILGDKIEYELFKHFILRSGVQMKPNRLGFGFIASINDKSSFGYGVISHHVLPLTHNVEIGFYF